MSKQAVETVTEDRTGPLRAPASKNELQSRTSGAGSLNTAFGSFVEVFKFFWDESFTYYGICSASRGSGSRDRAPRQSQAQPQPHYLRIKSTASVYHYRW